MIKIGQFVSVLQNPEASMATKAAALKLVVHFVGDIHQPLHDEDNGDRDGSTLEVLFDSDPDNLHWMGDSRLLQHINGNSQALAEELENRITGQNLDEWEGGSVLQWASEAHQLARAVVYGNLKADNPAPITAAYKRGADRAIKVPLNTARVRLKWLSNETLR
jgi:hypothetical protein